MINNIGVTNTNKSGIYIIKSLIDDKIYIGATKNFSRRYTQHKSALRLKRHKNKNLQLFFDINGELSLSFLVVEIVTDLSILTEKEMFYFEKMNVKDNGFNVNIYDPHSPLNIKRSLDCRKRMSEAYFAHSDEIKNKIRAASVSTKRTLSEEAKNKLVSINKKREYRLVSEESKIKMSLKKRGKSHIGMKWSDELRDKIRKNVLIASNPILKAELINKVVTDYNNGLKKKEVSKKNNISYIKACRIISDFITNKK